MVSKKKIGILAGILLPALVLLVLFYPTRERQVKKRFKVLRDWVRVEGPEEPLAQVGKYRGALELFSDPIEFESKAHEFSGNISADEGAKYAVQWRSRFRALDVEFKDITVIFPRDDEALATATLRIFGTMAGGATLSETHELQCSLRKGDKGWLFARFELVQVLEK